MTNAPYKQIKIWGSKKETQSSEIEIWETIPKDFLSLQKQPPKTKNFSYKKNKPWGARYALYGFLISILLQFAVLSVFLSIETAQLAASGMNIEQIEEEALKSIQSLGPMLLVTQLSMYVGWLVAMLYVTFRKGLHSFAKDFWLRFKWKTDIFLGITIAVGLRLAELLLFTILGLLGISVEGADNSSQWQGDTLWAYFFMFVIVSFVGPFFEELFFRGLLLQGLLKTFRRRSFVPRTWFGDKVQRTYPPLWYGFSRYKEFLYRHKYSLAIIVSSVAFGFMHFQGFESFGQWLVIIETGTVGAVLAYMTIKTKRLGLAIVTHIVFNFSGMFVSLFV